MKRSRRDRNESSAARTIEISLGRRIDTRKMISSVRNNRYYSQVDDDEPGSTSRTAGRWEADSGKSSVEERERGPSKTRTHDDG